MSGGIVGVREMKIALDQEIARGRTQGSPEDLKAVFRRAQTIEKVCDCVIEAIDRLQHIRSTISDPDLEEAQQTALALVGDRVAEIVRTLCDELAP